MSTDDLDAFLSRPLDEPADDGFSARVLARIALGSERYARFEGMAYGLVASVIVAALALSGIGDTIAAMTPGIVSSQPLAAAVAALILTGSYLGWSWSR